MNKRYGVNYFSSLFQLSPQPVVTQSPAHYFHEVAAVFECGVCTAAAAAAAKSL